MGNKSCEINKAFKGAILNCFAPYSDEDDKKDKGVFGLGKTSLETFRKHSSYSA